jgi:hypothetical protein
VDGGGILDSNIKKRFTITLKAFVGNELDHAINQMTTLGLLPSTIKRLSNLIVQNYKGHVTIVPNIKMTSYFKILSNPTTEEY